ncbi:hypothetical protein DUI87_02671 [Hirundo rustica rustica]|uniref:ribonuclease H n=1 Tax=Hirundo rustica rustica TaxID=333673 RepID=A0A3M0L878_HIRRU|nr:hypothetical protein DUI87_02671 [Hirundo rustica rustica]
MCSWTADPGNQNWKLFCTKRVSFRQRSNWEVFSSPRWSLTNGSFQPYSKIKQLPSEAFVTFVEQLTRAIQLQVKNEGAQEQVLEKIALADANEHCKATILNLPMEPAPTLDDMLQIPLHPDDAPCFAFSVPTLNREAPRKRYHWKYLPQGARNSLLIHQWYLSSLLSPVCAAAGEAIILHYMDDVLVCAPNDDLLSHALDLTIDSLVAAGFELQEEKIQRMLPWKYLGLEIGEKSSDAMKHLIQAFSFLGIPKSIKTDNGPTYTSKEFRSFLQQWGVEHKTGIPYSPTGQAIVERTHQNLRRVLDQQYQSLKLETPQIQLSKALFTLNFLNCTFENLNPPIVCHFRENCQLQLKAKAPVTVKAPATRETKSPHDLITWGRGYACVSTPSGPKWVPAKWVKPFIPKTAKPPAEAPQVTSAAWRRRKRQTFSL